MWEFHQKLNFVSTPWKTKIPLGNGVGDHTCVIQINLGNGFFFYIKASFIDNLVKKLDSGWNF